MAQPIEDYALISDCRSAALVGKDGSIDWLCFPRYDSASIFAALLGDASNGRWLLAPAEGGTVTSRRYDGASFVLVSRWVTSTGEVEVRDFMPHGNHRADVVRRVHGVRGTVSMRQELTIRFDYATAVPWVRQLPQQEQHGIVAVAGPDAVVVRGPRLTAAHRSHEGEFEVREGEDVDLQLTWFESYRPTPGPLDVGSVLEATVRWWQEWARSLQLGSAVDGPYSAIVMRSIAVLRALTHEVTGGIVAAATTSLPEQFGGERNWDYRYVWLRDASLTLSALLDHDLVHIAQEWEAWLLRAVAGDPKDAQIMYGIGGERHLPERTLTNLPGYEDSAPVRTGNGAVTQFQADVIGEVMVALDVARRKGVQAPEHAWPLQRALVGFVEKNWRRTDSGIWESRGRLRHYTYSRVMVWAAFDRAVKAVESGLDGPVDRWRALRDEVAAEIEEHGFNEKRNAYVQAYGTEQMDASSLMLPQVGYLRADDPRMLGTVKAIEEDLLQDGLVLRYRTEAATDGLSPGENPFLACNFWLVEQYAASGRHDDAVTLMDRLVGLASDVGLLSEQYDVTQARQAGNTPQALSHLALLRAAHAIQASTRMKPR